MRRRCRGECLGRGWVRSVVRLLGFIFLEYFLKCGEENFFFLGDLGKVGYIFILGWILFFYVFILGVWGLFFFSGIVILC